MSSLPSVHSISWSTNVADCRDAPSHNPLSLCSRVFTDSFPTLPCKKYSTWFCLPTTAIFFPIIGYPDYSTTSAKFRTYPEDWGCFFESGVASFFRRYKHRYLIFRTSMYLLIEKNHFRVTVSGYKNFALCRENFVYSENGAGLENQFPRSLAWLQELWKAALDHRGRHPSRNWGNTKTFVGNTTK